MNLELVKIGDKYAVRQRSAGYASDTYYEPKYNYKYFVRSLAGAVEWGAPSLVMERCLLPRNAAQELYDFLVTKEERRLYQFQEVKKMYKSLKEAEVVSAYSDSN